MDEISTQHSQQSPTIAMEPKENTPSVKKSTLDILKQFARVYMPVANMPGLTLN